MNTKILITVVVLLIIAEVNARKCYKCTACPKPFKGNEDGVDQIDVGDDDFCKKTIIPVINTVNRDSGGSDCTPVDANMFCCKGNLCNGSTTTTLSITLLAATASVLFVMRFFH